MAETTANYIGKIVATNSDRVRELPIIDGQLIFVQNRQRIAFDYNNKRVFYNQITTLNTEYERSELVEPLGGYYFVIDSASFYYFDEKEWTLIAGSPKEIVFIGVELPELGKKNVLYANTTDGKENISVWSEELNDYVVVADKTQEVTNEDIDNLFK